MLESCASVYLAASMKRGPLRHFRAFTLLELLVAVTIIGLLAALLLMSIGRARDSARQAQCANNLRQLGVAYQMYVDDYAEFFPPNSPLEGYAGMTMLGPYFGHSGKVLVCPSDSSPGKEISYYPNEYLADTKPAQLNWVNNPSKVVILRELHSPPFFNGSVLSHLRDSWAPIRSFSYAFWTGIDYSASYKAHRSGANMLFLDGSVRHYRGDNLIGQVGMHTLDLYDISALPWY